MPDQRALPGVELRGLELSRLISEALGSSNQRCPHATRILFRYEQYTRRVPPETAPETWGMWSANVRRR
ncbi:hypothetical protein FHX42_001338 [Saccharopolyspora lacisalsi]|uniref:Uncharacterized protein n=1 Tax=Halosaccharopolyspora lacisalsi TaxID=1000566 RepID=A0A839DTD1_9PSEU|nr:hypothetical protein [Halosaccharopolyspora lacisalsi]